MAMPSLFQTVAPDDKLGFGSGSQFRPKSVVDWLSFSNEDVSRIAAVSRASVRYDESAPKAVLERMQEIANIANMVASIFEDPDKTALWFKTKNPMLGDVTPRDMVRLGRYDRLRKFIISAMSDRAANGKVQAG